MHGTGEKTDIEIKKGEQIISEETSKKMLSIMQSVVDEGTGRNARDCRIYSRRKNWNIRRWSKHKQICNIIFRSSTNIRPTSCNISCTI